MSAFTSLPVHTDVVDGIRDLADWAIRMVTLSNGATTAVEAVRTPWHLEQLREVVVRPGRVRLEASTIGLAVRLGRLRRAPQDVMLVAVHPWDMHGAHQAG